MAHCTAAKQQDGTVPVSCNISWNLTYAAVSALGLGVFGVRGRRFVLLSPTIQLIYLCLSHLKSILKDRYSNRQTDFKHAYMKARNKWRFTWWQQRWKCISSNWRTQIAAILIYVHLAIYLSQGHDDLRIWARHVELRTNSYKFITVRCYWCI